MLLPGNCLFLFLMNNGGSNKKNFSEQLRNTDRLDFLNSLPSENYSPAFPLQNFYRNKLLVRTGNLAQNYRHLFDKKCR